MSVARTSEITAMSSKSFDDAIAEGVRRATETLRNVKHVWIKDQELTIENGSISAYKVTLKITFVLE